MRVTDRPVAPVLLVQIFLKLCFSILLATYFFGSLQVHAAPYGKTNYEYESLFSDEDLSLEDIQALPDTDWRRWQDDMHTANLLSLEQSGISGSVLWIKITLPRRSREEVSWIEFSPNVGLDGRIAQYVEGRWKWFLPEGLEIIDGVRHPVNFLTFKVFNDSPRKVAYLRLNTSLAYHFKINVASQSELLWQAVSNNLFNGILFGFLILAALYNLSIGISAGEKLYVYYAFYVTSNALYISITTGYLRLLFPEWGGLGNMGNLGASLVLFSGIIFVREFLNTRELAPKTDNVLTSLQHVLFVCLLFISFLGDFTALMLVLVLGTIAPITALTAGFIAHRAGHPYALFFLFAYGLFIASVMIWIGMWFGIFEPNLFVTQVFKVGTMIEITFLCLVLSNRYSYLKDQTEQLNHAKSTFKELSETDDLTGVLNRRGFLRQAEEIVHQRASNMIWLAIDIDHFKRFNDEHGHMAGDHLLAEFGNILDANRRREDLTAKLVSDNPSRNMRRAIVGRIGGEEFAVLLTECTLGQGKLYADRLIEEFRNLLVESMNGQRVGSTLSIGATNIAPEDSLESVWKRADALLYEAKAAGRDQVIVR